MPPQTLSNSEQLNLEKMPDEGIQENFSQRELVQSNSSSNEGVSVIVRSSRFSRSKLIDVAILCFINLINYMDRFTVAGILPDITETYGMTATQGGLLQTAFVLVYMFMAPLFGYLGDRFNRKYLMAIGVFFWSLTTLIGSYMPTYELFLLFRCFVGVGEASYSTIAPTIISDLFVNDDRSKMLALFYFAIPVGSGLGYITGAEVTHIADAISPHSEAWRWGLRVTPVFGLIAVVLLLFVLKEPPRGESEGGHNLEATSFLGDLAYLFTNPSYILSTIAFTFVTFVAGALSWWGPTFVEKGILVQPNPSSKVGSVAFVFGAIAMSAGIIGVPFGSFSGQYLRKRFPFADPVVCGVGLFLSFPLIAGGIIMAQYNTPAAYAVVFFGQVFLNLNWAIVSDIVLYVVIPTRRSSAEAFQILFSHMFGDAGSPYFVGLIADHLQPYWANSTNNDTLTTTTIDYDYEIMSGNVTTTTVAPPTDDTFAEFKALQYALIFACFFEILGGIFFVWNAVHITKDKKKCDDIIAGTSAVINNHLGPNDAQPIHGFADDPESSEPLIT